MTDIAKVRFAYVKDTPGTFKYKEVVADGSTPMNPFSGTLYIRKAALSAMGHTKAPQSVTIEVTLA